jgi:hypothetical protein
MAVEVGEAFASPLYVVSTCDTYLLTEYVVSPFLKGLSCCATSKLSRLVSNFRKEKALCVRDDRCGAERKWPRFRFATAIICSDATVYNVTLNGFKASWMTPHAGLRSTMCLHR